MRTFESEPSHFGRAAKTQKFLLFGDFKLQPGGSEQCVDSADSFSAAVFQVEQAGVGSPGRKD